jgi:hypothetical protein
MHKSGVASHQSLLAKRRCGSDSASPAGGGRGRKTSHNGHGYGEALECLVGPAPIGQVSKRIQCKNAQLTIRRCL